MIRVKICGLTTLEDAHYATESGADLLGFIFYPGSPRYIPPANVREIVRNLRLAHTSSCPKMIGAFVDEEPVLIRQTLVDCGLDYAQLHGREPPPVLRSLRPRAYKALQVRNAEQTLDEVRLYAPGPEGEDAIPSFLLDAYHPHKRGGTGQTFDWGIAREIGQRYPVLLAGGLEPRNVATAMQAADPWGVDVSSGVEIQPGKKDPAKIRRFIEAAKGGE